MRRVSGICTLLIFSLCLFSCIREEQKDSTPMECAISMAGGDSSGYKLLCGYNYDLLKMYAESEGRSAEIRMAGRRESILDSLRSGSLDIVALPFADSLAADSTLVAVKTDSCGIWGFRFRGNLWFEGDSIVVESTEAFEERSALYVMASFPKGMFEPAIQDDDTFEHKKQLAFEGSDYNDDDEDMSIGAIILISLLTWILPLLTAITYFWYVWRARRRANKDLLWYRDIPLDGNLQTANDILNAYRYIGTDYNKLLSACILKLINLGAIAIEQHPNKKGKLTGYFVIKEFKDANKQPVLLCKLHNIFKTAAGTDTILEPKELKSYMKRQSNESVIDSFINTLHTKTTLSTYKDRLDEVRQVIGLRKFLKEFTLLDERGIKEVSLWKDYMIYATLFGNAEQVIKDMKAINPEFFNMDRVAAQMADDMTLPIINSAMHSSYTRAYMNKVNREQRASGGGGHSSWGGGGGGFSGGGGGGGVR